MAGVPVPIERVVVDPPFTDCPGRVRYRVTLACGCHWWEDYPDGQVPTRVGDVFRCYAAHSKEKPSIVPVERAVAADRERPSEVASMSRGEARQAVAAHSGRHTERNDPTRSTPQPGDLLLRNASDGAFVVLDALSERHIVGPLPTLQAAIDAAHEHGGQSLWHQSVDERGRVLGPAMRLPSAAA